MYEEEICKLRSQPPPLQHKRCLVAASSIDQSIMRMYLANKTGLAVVALASYNIE